MGLMSVRLLNAPASCPGCLSFAMRTIHSLVTITAALMLAACQKETEKIVVREVDKRYSWSEITRPSGTDRIILSTGQDAHSLFLQSPSLLHVLTPQPGTRLYARYGYYGGAFTQLPTDIAVRVPFGAAFFARPAGDTTLRLTSPLQPVNLAYDAFIHVRALDPQATRIVTDNSATTPFGAINRNNYLLFGYGTALGFNDRRLHLVLARVNVSADGQVQADPRVLTIPSPFPLSSLGVLAAVDDYFLVDGGPAGIYKVAQTGAVKQVSATGYIHAFYKWKGTVYAVAAFNRLLVSTDDAESWVRYANRPDVFDHTTYHPVGDSLVVASHLAGTNDLFTLRWTGLTYHLRVLKNDGLGQAALSGVEQLGDTVYVGTTSGLFKRPLRTFFELKP